jgi:DNA-3-methyladenine glycosylase II
LLKNSDPLNYHQHLSGAYPPLRDLFDRVSPLPVLKPQQQPVAESVTKIVVGQMLSRAAAETIYARMRELCLTYQLQGCWLLSEADLLNCGLSRRKARTILEFGACYELNPPSFENWRSLSYSDLCEKVKKHWGLSQWSADMLAIFYFAKLDVFPETDGTIVRVRKILEENHLEGPLNPKLASPFSTFLARYMWALLDEGHLLNSTKT